MTIKSCFYPLIGTRCYGFMGDVLDAISMCATTMGVCTSLGLGVMQLDAGIERLNGGRHWLGEPYYNNYNIEKWGHMKDDLRSIWESYRRPGDTFDDSVAASLADTMAKNDQQTLLIWVITMAATTSVMCGLKYGIKTLALVCFGLGCFLMFYIWMMDDTWFLTDLFVQSVGHYIQNLPQRGFYTSAFERMESGNADGHGENPKYMDWWTIFYWGWWIAWAPFVGVFLARIARGRTIRQFILWTVVLPTVYNLLFMGLLGGAALKMQMAAEKLKIGVPDCGKAGGWDNDGHYHVSNFQKNVCREVGKDSYTKEPEYFCSTITNLHCSIKEGGTPATLYNVLEQYADAGTFLCVIAMVALTLYFVASSDSGSMVDDMISANGLPEPPLPQRLFWALTEGAAATVLLRSGIYTGTAGGGLKALRAVSICVGLPYTFFICFMCLALWRALQYETKDRAWKGNYFSSEITDIGVTVYTASAGTSKVFNGRLGSVQFKKLSSIVAYVVCPLAALWPGATQLAQKKGRGRSFAPKAMEMTGTLCFYAWLIICCVDYASVSTSPIKMGSEMGNATDASGTTLYYLSTRYGHFRGWTNEIEEGAVVTTSDEVNRKAGEAGPGVGERVGRNMRIEAIGWFFYFCFVTVVAFLRNDTRATYKIPGTLIEDFLAAAFVYPTVLYQIKDQVTTKEIPEAVLGDKTCTELASHKETVCVEERPGDNNDLTATDKKR